MRKRKILCFALAATLLMLLTSCGKTQTPNPVSSELPEQETIGDVFLSSNLKIKSSITDHSVNPKRVVTVELYVDSEGDGQGLLGFGDLVLDVIVVKDKMYVVVDTGVVVGITDITGRLVFSDTEFSAQADMEAMGFTLDANEIPVTYGARKGTTSVETQYAQSVNDFETASVIASSDMTLLDAVSYIMDYNAEKEVNVEAPEEEEPVNDFYINSKYGVTIDGKVFSVGDTCNPETYFNNATPEGLLHTYEYNEDTRVDFEHVSYLSSTGRTVFVLTSNYVQSITTDADFEFLGIKPGISDKELKRLLGYKLTKKDMETFVPIDDSLVVNNFKSSTYYCTVANLSVEFRIEKSVLKEIYIEQKLDFKG